MCIFTINRTPSKIIFINPKTNQIITQSKKNNLKTILKGCRDVN